jgi:uncharacterized membrane protein
MRKTIAKAVTWRLIGTAEIFAISFWTTGHIATAGHTAGIAAIASFLSYVAHELAWNGSFSRDRVAECGKAVAIRIIGLSAQIIDLVTQASPIVSLERHVAMIGRILRSLPAGQRWREALIVPHSDRTGPSSAFACSRATTTLSR